LKHPIFKLDEACGGNFHKLTQILALKLEGVFLAGAGPRAAGGGGRRVM
jgi:hypothetical protein